VFFARKEAKKMGLTRKDWEIIVKRWERGDSAADQVLRWRTKPTCGVLIEQPDVYRWDQDFPVVSDVYMGNDPEKQGGYWYRK